MFHADLENATRRQVKKVEEIKRHKMGHKLLLAYFLFTCLINKLSIPQNDTSDLLS